jgi:flagellar hook-associated protein 1 FlgK
MAIFGPLAIGRQALLAHERGVQVAGHNIANVNTPGFSRQRVVLAPVRLRAPGFFGGGVVAGEVLRAVDPFIEARRLAGASALAGATTGRDVLQRLETLFPVASGGIGDALQRFFAGAEALANQPQDLAVRGELLARAEALAAELRRAAGSIAALQREVDGRAAAAAGEANARLQAIAALNREIVAAEAGGGAANDLRDLRQRALGELAGLLRVTAIEQADGAVNVLAASGVGLVLGVDAAVLAVEPGAGSGLDGAPLGRVGVRVGGSVVPFGADAGGALGSLLALRDQTLPAAAGDLDRLALALRDAVNAVQTDAAGRDLDGLPGTALFAGTGAGDLAVVLDDPRGIAAARGDEPGDNAGALALAAVGETPLAALGGATLEDFFGALLATIGSQARRAGEQAEVEERLDGILAAQRDAVSGVSLEEELTELIRFQRGFQAATHLIAVSDRLLDDLLGMLR